MYYLNKFLVKEIIFNLLKKCWRKIFKKLTIINTYLLNVKFLLFVYLETNQTFRCCLKFEINEYYFNFIFIELTWYMYISYDIIMLFSVLHVHNTNYNFKSFYILKRKINTDSKST